MTPVTQGKNGSLSRCQVSLACGIVGPRCRGGRREPASMHAGRWHPAPALPAAPPSLLPPRRGSAAGAALTANS